MLPSDVARRIHRPDTGGTEGSESPRSEIAKAQRQVITGTALLPVIAFPRKFDAIGTEHVVRFRGLYVEKHQHSDGWIPVLDHSGLLSIEKALPLEYLPRLELQNELLGDQIRVIGLTRASRFAIQ